MKKSLCGVLNVEKLMKVTKQSKKPGFPELRKSASAIKFPAWAEIKYDGEFCYVLYTPQATCLVNKYGTVRENFPALDEIEARLMKNGIKAGIFLAELYYGDGFLHDIYKLNSNKKSDALNLKVFDVLQCGHDEVSNFSLLDRKEILADCLGDLAIKGQVVANLKEATEYFEKALKDGYEGVVLKEFDTHLVIGPCSWAKLKGKDRTDYLIVTVDQDKERIEVAVPGPNKKVTIVGCKAPNRYKKHCAVGNVITIEHQGILPSGSLRHPVLIPQPGW